MVGRGRGGLVDSLQGDMGEGGLAARILPTLEPPIGVALRPRFSPRLGPELKGQVRPWARSAADGSRNPPDAKRRPGGRLELSSRLSPPARAPDPARCRAVSRPAVGFDGAGATSRPGRFRASPPRSARRAREGPGSLVSTWLGPLLRRLPL